MTTRSASKRGKKSGGMSGAYTKSQAADHHTKAIVVGDHSTANEVEPSSSTPKSSRGYRS